jgi:iron complex outermembrane receptor protein
MGRLHRVSQLQAYGAWALVITSGMALAQNLPESTGLQEIVVTAQRRPENLQSVPISMDAITGATLENLGEKNFFDYASTVPNLAVGIGAGAGGAGSGFGVSTSRAVAIRGVAGNNTTGFYLNDTPVPLSLDPRALDIEQVEVLRGPQGTLFGAGSMGGTVRIITREPALDQTSGKVDAEGSYVNHGGGGYAVDGTINIPLLTDAVALRVSAFSGFDPGYFTRVWGVDTAPSVDLLPGSPSGSKSHVGARQNTGLMASMRVAPPTVPGLSITPMFIYQRFNSNGYPLADYAPDDLVQNRPLDVPEAVADTWDFASVTVKYKAPFGRFVGYGTNFYRNGYDQEDGTDFAAGVVPGLPYFVAAPINNNLYTETWSGEARFESTLSGPVQFVVGVFSELDQRRWLEIWNAPGANAASGGALGTDLLYFNNSRNADRQRAEFLNVSYDISPAIQIAAGVRREYLDHSFTNVADGWFNGGPTTVPGNHGEHDTAPRFTARYEFAPSQMVYASAAKGFRIGGQNTPLPPLCASALAAAGLTNGSPFSSDSLWSFEVGTKNSWLGDRVKSRVAVYRIDWSQIQQTTLLPEATCGFAVTTNSGASVSKGAEFELDAAPSDNLTFNLAAGYEDAKITEATAGSLTVVGQPLNQVPTWNGSAKAQYSVPIGERSMFVRGVWVFSGSRISYNNIQSGRELGAYNLLNLRTGVKQGPWELAIFADNVFDVRGNLGDLLPESGELTGRPRYLITTPRTIGVHMRRDF